MLDKQRKIIELQNNWKFSKTDITNAEQADFDDSNWAKVRVPHDWAITGPIDKENNAQTGGLPVAGTAWYRKLLPIQNFENKRVFIEFDGVMSNSAVFLNGHRVGNRPYGYISFSYDLTPYLENQNNLLAVRVSPEKSASRWYPGAGIYRREGAIQEGAGSGNARLCSGSEIVERGTEQDAGGKECLFQDGAGSRRTAGGDLSGRSAAERTG